MQGQAHYMLQLLLKIYTDRWKYLAKTLGKNYYERHYFKQYTDWFLAGRGRSI